MMVVARVDVLLKPTMTVKASAAMVLLAPVKPVRVIVVWLPTPVTILWHVPKIFFQEV